MSKQVTQPSDDEPAQEKGSRLFTGIVWLIAAPVVYLLSAGPAIWVHVRISGTAYVDKYEMVLHVTYWPIEWLYDNYSGAWPLDAFAWYLDRWQ